ncbi:tyrosine-type recombinase/integrase [Aquamicrobium sp.]|uniref:tyrosine-type recombinase/integrase n=1 Tax=Aquamicrobium sp. TaxID=1872579 RepID=UPI00258B18D4|nr:tyrosine-type recombinase/integrase [Aquamicrobium sp.]MCK9549475.1 tyrosine-type recombinase/integrase [Aquamicrobium sp.]
MKKKNNKLSSEIAKWQKSYLRDLKNRTKKINTFEVYKFLLDKLHLYSNHQDEVNSILDCDREFFLSFLEWLEDGSETGIYSQKTKALYISILKAFFMYISDNNKEYIDYSTHFRKLVSKKVGKGKGIKYLSDKELVLILDYIEKDKKDKKHYSYVYALGIKLMVFAGLRISEVLKLTLKDFSVLELANEDTGEDDLYKISLEDTKSVEDQVALIKIEDIADEMRYFSSILSPGAYIFSSLGKPNPMNRRSFYRGVKIRFEKAGINRTGLHIFRHTCAMNLYRTTNDVLVTQKKLRHADIKTTMIYAHAEQLDVARATRGVKKK